MSQAFEAVASAEEPEHGKAEDGQARNATDDAWGEEEDISAIVSRKEGRRDGRASDDGARVRVSSVVFVLTVARVAQLVRRKRYLSLSPLHAQKVDTSAEVASQADRRRMVN